MDDKTKNMLIVAMEECAEIAQACSKSIRFGLENHHPNKSPIETHKDEIMTEYYQLQSIIEELQLEHTLPYYTENRIYAIKKDKINKVNRHYKENKNK